MDGGLRADADEAGDGFDGLHDEGRKKLDAEARGID
jgi:hypothetical protein